MSAADVEYARERILELLGGKRRISMQAAIRQLREEPNVREDALRVAVWEMIDRGEVKLTPNRELRAA